MSRRAARAAVVGAVVLSSMVVASPAMAALHRDDGDDPGEGMSKLKVLGVFIGIPILWFALIWIVVSIPSMIRGPRYRPGKDWEATPEWIGAPGDGLEGGHDDPALTAGESQGALTGTVVEPGEGGTDTAGGGTSARW